LYQGKLKTISIAAFLSTERSGAVPEKISDDSRGQYVLDRRKFIFYIPLPNGGCLS